MAIKTLNDIKKDMSELYDSIKDRTTDLPIAKELNNSTGKYLKAASLEHAMNVHAHTVKMQAAKLKTTKRRTK